MAYRNYTAYSDKAQYLTKDEMVKHLQAAIKYLELAEEGQYEIYLQVFKRIKGE